MPSKAREPALVTVPVLVLSILLIFSLLVVPARYPLTMSLIRPWLQSGPPFLFGPNCRLRLCLVRVLSPPNRLLARVPYVIWLRRETLYAARPLIMVCLRWVSVVLIRVTIQLFPISLKEMPRTLRRASRVFLFLHSTRVCLRKVLIRLVLQFYPCPVVRVTFDVPPLALGLRVTGA